MNFTQSFEEFSSSLGPMDLALYAGIGIILWVLFKDKLSPVQKIIMDLFDQVKGSLPKTTPSSSQAVSKDIFFDLVASWKQTRDLAVKSGCTKAVEVADQMFPYLSPTICTESETDQAEVVASNRPNSAFK